MSSRGGLRIAVIGTRGIPGAYSGVERVAEILYPRLVERGHDVTVYCRTDPGRRGPERYRGVQRVELPALRHRSLETLSHNLLSLVHALSRRRYDVVQLEAVAAGLLSGTCRIGRAATVVRVHGLDWQRAKWGRLAARVLRAGEAAAARHADEIIVVSSELKRHFARTYGRDVAFIPNGIPEDRGAPRTSPHLLPAECRLVPGRYFVCISRIVPEKRIEDAILALRRVPGPHALAIAGTASYTDAYVARLRSLAAADGRIVFTGFRSGVELDALLEHATAFVSPSELEGLPMSVLECIGRGVPAVLSDIAPHRELVGGTCGERLLHPVRDVAALADRMRRVAADPVRYRAAADAVRTHVRRTFSWSTIVDRTESILHAAIERRARVRSSPAISFPGRP